MSRNSDDGFGSETDFPTFLGTTSPSRSSTSGLTASFGAFNVSGSPQSVTSHAPTPTPIVDEYGFVNKFACSREAYLAFRERYRASKSAIEARWKRLCTFKTAKGSVSSDRVPSAATLAEYVFQPYNPAVKKAIRAGIPSYLRPAAWFYYSGAEAERARYRDPTAFYESLVMQPKPSAFYMLADRMKADFLDVLPTNQIVRKDYFSSSNVMMNDCADGSGRVKIIPERSETLPPGRPRRLSMAIPLQTTQQQQQQSLLSSSPPLVSSFHHSTTPFMTRLYNVLVAFLAHRPNVEYCRALCTIASVMLLVIQDEERTFWILSALFGNYAASAGSEAEAVVFEDFSNSNSSLASVSASQCSSSAPSPRLFKHFPSAMFKDTSTCGYASLDGFSRILAKKRPQLANQLTKLELPVALITTNWFQSLFIDVLPTEASMRLLDAFIGEGFKVLYRVGLAVFMMNEEELMLRMRPDRKANSGTSALGANFPAGSSLSQGALSFIKGLPKRHVDADQLMDFAFNSIGSLSMSTVLAECQAASLCEKPLQSIRRFSLTPEMQLTMSTVRRLSLAMDGGASKHR
jgi:hypothetical protein